MEKLEICMLTPRTPRTVHHAFLTALSVGALPYNALCLQQQQQESSLQFTQLSQATNEQLAALNQPMGPVLAPEQLPCATDLVRGLQMRSRACCCLCRIRTIRDIDTGSTNVYQYCSDRDSCMQ